MTSEHSKGGGVRRSSSIPKARVRALSLALGACFCAPPAWSANIADATVVNGIVNASQNGNVLTIANSNGAILDWAKFGIAAGETVKFDQASASSSVLNRVLAGGGMSAIYGTLSSNGRVFLVNPAGIMVGAGGVVDTAGFVASTLAMKNSDFLAGKLTFGGDGNIGGDVINKGTITTPTGGAVYLVGGNVTNEGIINTPKGEVILAAGQTVSLVDTSTPGIKVDITGAEGNTTNLGEIAAAAGRIGMVGVIVKNSGIINASSAVEEGGRVFLKASQDTYVDKAGRIVATGTKGGRVEVLGNRVAVMDQATIDASGTNGGGTILVGGDYQGKNPDVQNSEITFFGPEATLKADATDNGNGGKVIVWADDTTRAYGTISAKGGANGGDGGFIETSGHRYLDVNGIKINASATAGAKGTWLLDPDNITIVASGGPDSNITGNPFTHLAAGNSTLRDATINSALSGANVSVLANNDILFDGSTYGAIVIDNTSGAGRSLTLNAGNDIIFSSGTTTFQNTNGGVGSFAVQFSPATNRYVTINSGATANFTGLVSGTTGLVTGAITGAATGRSWQNYGTVNINENAFIQLNNTVVSTFNNNSGGIINVVASGGPGDTNGWSFKSSGANAPLNNYGTIYINTSYTSWEPDFGQSSGGVLNIAAGKTLGMQNAAVIEGAVNIGSGGKLWLPLSITAQTFYGATIAGPGTLRLGGSSTTGVTFSNVTTSGGLLVTLEGGGYLSSLTGSITDTTFADKNLTTFFLPTSGVTYSGNIGFLAGGTLQTSLCCATSLSTSGNLLLVGGWDGTSPVTAPIADNGAGHLQLNGGTSITAGGTLKMYAGGNFSASSNFYGGVSVNSTGAQEIKAGGSISLTGSIDGGVSVVSNSSQTITSGSTITLTAGSSGINRQAAFTANGAQVVSSGGGIFMYGGGSSGSDYNDHAGFYQNNTSGSQSITVYGGGSITMYGGAGSGTGGNAPYNCGATCTGQDFSSNRAAIFNAGSGGQTINFAAGGNINLTGGTNGWANNAVIRNFAGAQVVTGVANISLTGGASGGAFLENPWGGSYRNNSATILSQGSQSITASGSITQTGGAGGIANGASIIAAGGTQSVTVGGSVTLAAGLGNGASAGIRNTSTSAQTLTFTGTATLALTGGNGAGTGARAVIESAGSQTINAGGALTISLQGGSGTTVNQPVYENNVQVCASCGTNNHAEIKSGSTQNITYQTINITGGSGGNNNYAEISADGSATFTGSGGNITVYGGSSGGIAIASNAGGISADGGLTINTVGGAIALNSAQGAAYGGAFVGSDTSVTINTGAGALSLTAGTGYSGTLGLPYDTPLPDNYLMFNPVAIGSDSGSLTTINLTVGSLTMNGGQMGTTGGSAALIGGIKGTPVNLTINSAGPISLTGTSALSARIGSQAGGSVTMYAGGTGMSLGNGIVGTGRGNGGSLALYGTGTGSISQIATGQIGSDSLYATTASTGTINLPSYYNSIGTFNATTANQVITFNGQSIGLGSVNAGTGAVSIVAYKDIHDENGLGTVNITGGSVTLTSQYGGDAGALAISVDTAASGGITATVNATATNGGISVRNMSGTPTGGVTLTDNATSNKSAHFHNAASFSTSALGGLSLTATGGVVDISSNGNLTIDSAPTLSGSDIGIETPGVLVVSSPLSSSGSIALASGTALAVAGSVTSSGGDVYMISLGNLDVSAPVSAYYDTLLLGNNINILAGGSVTTTTGDIGMLAFNNLNIGGAVTAGYDALLAGNTTVNINAAVKGQSVGVIGGIPSFDYYNLTAIPFQTALLGGTVNILPSGSVTSTAYEVGVLAKDINIYGGSVNAAGNAQLGARDDITLRNGAKVVGTDVYLAMFGPNSTLTLNDLSFGQSASTIWARSDDTIDIRFWGRSAGGLVIDGVETGGSVLGANGSGLFAGIPPHLATQGNGLNVFYGVTKIDSAVLDSLIKGGDSINGLVVGSDLILGGGFGDNSLVDNTLTAGGGDDQFGGPGEQDNDKDKKGAQGDGKGKKSDKAKKAVGQCRV